MKKATKFILCALLVIVAGALVIVNRRNAAANDALAAAKQLEFTVNDQKVIYDYDESGDHYVTFDTQMKRKNGDVFDRTYSGIEFADILKDLGIEITDDMTVTAVCGDSYEIALTAEEILNPGNVYLVTKENDEELDEESGPFMLVVNYDEFSTRWAKNVVKITVNE
ncbi:MAG: molybdopterin-dependent oxidoreductase [Solobacterium sp.]|nr:molybdopterin-dependent oxidoreductase [Solobacterium sp.]